MVRVERARPGCREGRYQRSRVHQRYYGIGCASTFRWNEEVWLWARTGDGWYSGVHQRSDVLGREERLRFRPYSEKPAVAELHPKSWTRIQPLGCFSWRNTMRSSSAISFSAT
ncbi:hypothetical protein CBM2625_U10039 [Cupriavidus taiwanensis]|nr:hypothetical protein CBM2625_U10039 [Cupriavidus taiwanensis]